MNKKILKILMIIVGALALLCFVSFLVIKISSKNFKVMDIQGGESKQQISLRLAKFPNEIRKRKAKAGIEYTYVFKDVKLYGMSGIMYVKFRDNKAVSYSWQQKEEKDNYLELASDIEEYYQEKGYTYKMKYTATESGMLFKLYEKTEDSSKLVKIVTGSPSQGVWVIFSCE